MCDYEERRSMNVLFKSFNEKTQYVPSNDEFNIIATCEENGEFEIKIKGNHGSKNAKIALERSLKLVSKNRWEKNKK